MKIFVPLCFAIFSTVSGQNFPVALSGNPDGQPLVVDAETLIKFGLIHGKSDPIPPKLNFYQYPNGKIVKRVDNFEPGALSHIAIPEPQVPIPVSPAALHALSPQQLHSFGFPYQTAGGAGSIADPGVVNGPQVQGGGAGLSPLNGVNSVGAIIPAAVVSNHKIAHYDTIPSLVSNPNTQEPTTIDVPANVIPVNFIFRSASSVINVEHKHEGATGSFKETLSTDEPHQLHHTVQKPIIQQVREIISPFRRIEQTVEPVREEIQTLVAQTAQPSQSSSHEQHILEQQQQQHNHHHQQHQQQQQQHQNHHHNQQLQSHHHHNKMHHSFLDNIDQFALNSEKHLKKIPTISTSLSKNRMISFKPNMMQFPTSSSLFSLKSSNEMFTNARQASSLSPLSSSSTPQASHSSLTPALHHPFSAFSTKSRPFFMSAP